MNLLLLMQKQEGGSSAGTDGARGKACFSCTGLFTVLWPALALLIALPLRAQTQSQVMMQVIIRPPYSPYFDQMRKSAVVNFTNTGRQDVTLYLQARISDGTKFIQTKKGVYSEPILVPAGRSVMLNNINFNYGSFLGPDVIDYNLGRANLETAYSARILPEGNYTYCVSVFTRVRDQYFPFPVTGSGCAAFPVFFAQPPIITNPIDKAVVSPGTSPVIRFSWIPPTHSVPASAISYDLYLVKVNDGDRPETDMQNAVAYHSNYYLKIPGIKTSNYVFNTKVSPFKLDTGQCYAVMVQARDAAGKTFFADGGKSQVITFTTNGTRILKLPPGLAQLGDTAGNHEASSQPPVMTIESDKTVNPSCLNVPVSGNTTDIGVSGPALLAKYPAISIGSFTLMIDKGVQRNADATYTGTGYISWAPYGHPIKLKVSFSHISVNTDGGVYAGSAVTSTDGSFQKWAPLVTADNLKDEAASLTGLDLSSADYDNLEGRINDAAHQVNEVLGNDPVDMPLGLNNKSLAGIPSTLAIMGIVFTPSGTSMNVLFNLNIPDAGEWLSLAGSCFQITPDGMSVDDGLLYLPEDHTLTVGGAELVFKKCKIGDMAVDTTGGTYLKWTSQGLQKILANVDVVFPRTDIIPVDAADVPVAGKFTLHTAFQFTSWNDWVATAMPGAHFEINGLPGMMISAKDGIVYDHSLKRDPAGFALPDNYQNPPAGNAFEGLYVADLSLTLPPDFKTFQGSAGTGRATVDFHHFILDADGVSFHLMADNLIDLNTGDLGGWEFSVDHFELGIVQNNLDKKGIMMNGRIRLPVSTTDALSYTCNLNAGEGSGLHYQFVVTPADQYKMQVWAATLALDHTSSIIIQDDKQGMAVEARLNGHISLTLKDPSLSLTALSFQNMVLSNRDSTDPKNPKTGFYFNGGNWSLGGEAPPEPSAAWRGLPPGSPALAGPHPPAGLGDTGAGEHDGKTDEQKVDGFDLTLNDITPTFTPKGATSYEMGVGFDMDINIGFGDASLVNGSTSLTVVGTITVPGDGPPAVGTPHVNPSKIHVDGDLGPVKVTGGLDFRSNDPVYGDGIYGALSAVFPFAKLTAEAQFGTSPKGIQYWAVGGSLFMTTGIPMGPALMVNGFGGAIYHNMTFTLPSTGDIRKATVPGTFKMTPQAATTGIKAQLIVSMMTPEIINASLALTTEIHHGHLGKMELDGEGFLITDPPSNSSALAHATMQMSYDFPTHTFDSYVGVDLKFLTATAHVPIWMHGGPGTDGADAYYLYIGRPDQGEDNRASITLLNLGKPGDILYVNLGATAYFDAGTVLPDFPPLPPKVAAFLGGNPSEASVKTLLHQLAASGNPGFMFGADVSGEIDVSLLFLYAKASAEIGFDVALEKVETVPASCLQSDSTFGLNHWYAVGQLYAYLALEVGVHVDVWFVEGNFTLMSLDAGALLQAGLPNPTWGEGQVHVKGSVLGGLISVDSDFPFSFGDKCQVDYNPLDGIKMITDAGPKDNAGVFDKPYVAFSLPMNGTDYSFNAPSDQYVNHPYQRTFHFRMGHFDLYKEKADGSDSLIKGYNYLSPDGHTSVLYRDVMLDPRTRYKMDVECYAKEMINGSESDPREGPRSQDTTIYFTTGAAPDHIVRQNVVYTYPIDGQRFLLKDAFNGTGVVKLGNWQQDLFPGGTSSLGTPRYTYQLKFIPEDGGETITTSFSADKSRKTLDFKLPQALKNSETYRMEVWVAPALKRARNVSRPSVVYQTQQVHEHAVSYERNSKGKLEKKQTDQQGVVNVRGYKASAVNGPAPLGAKPIYTLRFRTSQFNSFAEKMNSFGSMSTTSENGHHDIYLASRRAGAEPFDEFEIRGYTSSNTTGYPPKRNFPPLFMAAIPFDYSAPVDKYIFDKMYVKSLKLIPEFSLDYGAPEVRHLIFPEYTVSTQPTGYMPRLAPAKKFNLGGAVTASYAPSPLSDAVGRPVANAKLASGAAEPSRPQQMVYRRASYLLPPSYYTGRGKDRPNPAEGESSSGYSNLYRVGFSPEMTSGIRLKWMRDEYVYADYALLHAFAENFLSGYKEAKGLTGSFEIVGLVQHLAITAGEYGSISLNPDYLSDMLNDQGLYQVAQQFSMLKFPRFAPTTGRGIDFRYRDPFCDGCKLSSTVKETFDYGHAVNAEGMYRFSGARKGDSPGSAGTVKAAEIPAHTSVQKYDLQRKN